MLYVTFYLFQAKYEATIETYKKKLGKCTLVKLMSWITANIQMP